MSELTRVTANFVPQAMADLEEAAGLEELSYTDALNRAVRAYALLVRERKAGSRLWLQRPGTKTMAEVEFL